MLTFSCNTCKKKYDASCLDGKATYLIGNKRYIIKHEGEDCGACRDFLKQMEDQKREQLRMESKEL